MAQKTVANVFDAQGSPLAVSIEVSGHHLIGDEPEAIGGRNLGPNPYDLLAAALGECTAVTIRWYALRQGWAVDHVHVQVRHIKKIEAGSERVIDEFRKTISIVGPDLSTEQREKLLDIAAKCPIHQTLTGTIRIATESEK